jgi:CheY-like chemotaxis protein
MAARSGWKQPMILILDGDDGVRDSLRFLLECAGFKSFEFASCREFLDVDCSGDRDCLILDLHMPEMSGIELLEEMRRRGKTLPAILITGRLDSTLGSALAPLAHWRSSRSHTWPPKSSTRFGRPWVRRKSRPFDRDCLP